MMSINYHMYANIYISMYYLSQTLHRDDNDLVNEDIKSM